MVAEATAPRRENVPRHILFWRIGYDKNTPQDFILNSASIGDSIRWKISKNFR
jgi:hypothetical protein